MSAATSVAVPRTTRRRPYLAIAQTAMQQAVAYRINTLAGIIGNFFWIAILYYLWRAAFAQEARIGTFTWDQMRTYILLAYGISALVGFSTASGMMQAIRTGDIVMDMIRPINYLRRQLAQAVGLAALECLFSFSIVIVLGFVVIQVVPPASPLAAFLFVASVGMGFVTKFLVVFAISLLCFWTISAVGLNWAQTAVVNVLSGVLVPVQLLPDWLRPIAEWSPLRGIVATPVGIYLGQYEGWRLVGVLALQSIWLVVLWVAADRLWPRAFRAVQVQGG
jgi:ABC-2 type transport system permease protein